jgi:glycosyltransferase involved in cell wall biosynthesis
MKFIGHHEIKVVFRLNVNELLDYDLIIMQRQYLPQVKEMINILQSHGKKIAYELDDDMWHIPPQNESRVFWDDEKIAAATEVIKSCDAVTTSTKPLAEVIREHNRNVFIIPNYIPDMQPLDKFDSIIRIGWSGSLSHSVDYNDDIIRALRDIKQKYKGRVELVFCGWIPEGLVGHVTYYEPVPPMHYLFFLNELRLHIGIIPCAKMQFNECKSNLKFLEYSLTRTASIASAIYPYVNTITENMGILIQNGTYQEWYDSLDQLVSDSGLRNRLTDSAREYVRTNYLIQNKVGEIENTYSKILQL